ncbi:MAG: hypothetical protein CMC74_09020 [Flavobacteriaceae bacterium]|nr:hypothetical protein [Flavobacteriaceae bacterium]|tara:strand:- start:64752 stop:65399 length:648 start_codon:yes stop_codon:yes gene_type:complete
MKINYSIILLIAITLSCGNSKEQEQLHLQKVEVGKSRLKTDLTNHLEELKEQLNLEKRELNQIKEFQFGRSSSTKAEQLQAQNKIIGELTQYISKVEEEIALTNLRETFDFQDTPEGLINYIFQAAKTREFNKLRNLCDPYGEHDADAKSVCLVEMQPSEIQLQFIQNFENGRIIGEPIIQGESANVEIAFGPSTSRLETIHLIKRMDKWYLKGF